MYVQMMKRGKDMVLAMVLIEGVSMFLILIKRPTSPSTAVATTTTETRSNNENDNRDMQTTTQQSQNGIADHQQSTSLHQYGRTGE